MILRAFADTDDVGTGLVQSAHEVLLVMGK